MLNEQDFGVNRWKDKRPKLSWTTTLHYCYTYVDAQIKLILIVGKMRWLVGVVVCKRDEQTDCLIKALKTG